jgi:hypothetical protein
MYRWMRVYCHVGFTECHAICFVVTFIFHTFMPLSDCSMPCIDVTELRVWWGINQLRRTVSWKSWQFFALSGYRLFRKFRHQLLPITNSMERNPSWGANSRWDIKKFSVFYRTLRFITVFTKALYWSLSFASWIQFRLPPHCGHLGCDTV